MPGIPGKNRVFSSANSCRFATGSRHMTPSKWEPSWNLPQFLPEKWELSYLGPGGLDSVFYLPFYCIESRPNLELASGNCES